MKLSVVIPVYNEQETIKKIIERVWAVDLGPVEKEIIVVDDASTDATERILGELRGITVLRNERNLGKGGALKRGIKKATGEIVLFQDADLEYDPNDYHAMIQPILEEKTEVTIGVRIQPERDIRRQKSFYWLSWVGNKLITLVTNWLYWNSAGEYEGCYKAFTKHLISSIEIETDGFDFDNELICKILRSGHSTVDVPIRYYPRSYEQGKKINWRHGVKILWTIIKWRFRPLDINKGY